MQDIVSQRSPKRIAECFDDLIWYLLENTQAQICFSLVIPTKNDDSLNKKIKEVNETLSKLITDARSANPIHKSCLFSYSNDAVEHQNIYNRGSQEIRLTDIGKLIMWTRLSDGLSKTLRLPRKQLSAAKNINRQASRPTKSNNQNNNNNE